MKRRLAIAILVCVVLTFMGAGWVIYNSGHVSAGYAVIPMLVGVALLAIYRTRKE